MGFYNTLIQQEGLKELKKKSLWRYMLSDDEFEQLRKSLQFADPYFMDSRDATLWYAFWWQRCYNGGKPSMQNIFEDLGGNITYKIDAEQFYKIAKEGAERIGIKWLKGQSNFLRFKTMLLQGGLPIQHMDNNASAYSNFLLAAVDVQPQTIDDIKLNPELYLLLPSSSQNDIIYANCLEIVQSILDNEDSPYDGLLKTKENLKALTDQLRVRRNNATNTHNKKAKVFWLIEMDKDDDQVQIFLHLGFATKYRKIQSTETDHELSTILGFNPTEAVYPLYINDRMIVQFVRTISGDYTTDWMSKKRIKWNTDPGSLEICTYQDNTKIALTEIVQNEPDLEYPSLWAPYDSNLWRLVKGSACTAEKAAVLMSNDWNTVNDRTALYIEGNHLNWVPFEGELCANHKNNTWCFQQQCICF